MPNYFERDGSFSYKRISIYDASTSDLLEYADAVVSFISAGKPLLLIGSGLDVSAFCCSSD